MKQKSRLNLKSITVAAYAVTALLFIVFAVYMFALKDNKVYSARDIASYKTVANYSTEEIEDASAPIGVRRKYSWQIENIDNNESCLIFYIVHCYAEVRFDDELIYSLTPGENTRIGNSPSSNWVVVPIYPSDIGRIITVTVTPVYKSVQNRKIVFNIGSRYAVFMQRLKADLPQLILSSLCILMGILLITVQLCFIANKRASSADMLYLGIFSLLVGIWRITDTRFSPVMFYRHPAALGYIALSALFVMAVPLLLFVDERHAGKFHVLLRLAALVNCAAALAALLCQVAGIAELRETLTVCHIMLILDIAVLIFVFFLNALKGVKERTVMILIALLVSGSIADFVYFYLKDTSSGMMFTSIAFIVYTFYLFTVNILDVNKKAYIDVNTKLYSRTRWEAFIKDHISNSEPIGVMMLDLNCLKHINDTYGHKTGDKMIVAFSDILRSTFAPGEFLCRWGGDEFAVIVRNADREKMEGYNDAIHTAAEAYNGSGAKPEMYFACGYALSTEFPDASVNELLRKADARMYSDKRQWYDKHSATD